MAVAQVLVRDLPEDVVRRLKTRAAAAGRSLEAELRIVLTAAAEPDRTTARQVADRISQETAGRTQSDSTALIRADRDR